MIEIKNLIKTYDRKSEAINIANLTIKDNTIVGLIGVNGSGKSTLLRLITGVFKEDAGEIKIDGKEVYDNEESKKDILFISDNPIATTNTSIKSIEDFYVTFYKMDPEKYHANLKLFDLPNKGSLSKFSKGMRRRVFIAVALAIRPKILILDEAFDGIDSVGRDIFKKELLKVFQENKMIVIIASHSLRELEDICDQYILLKKGKIASQGSIDMQDGILHKYVIGFKDATTSDTFNCAEFINIYGQGKIFTIITRLNMNDFTKYISKFNPALIDEQELTFEELFINTNEEDKKYE
jgi:ABC-type multidrug transport system, ATPase component